MVDILGIATLFWRPDIVWRTGNFDFRTTLLLFVISLVFAFAVQILLGASGRRMFAAVSLPLLLVTWIIAFPYFMGLAGMELGSSTSLLFEAGSVLSGHITSLIFFLILWSVFELLVLKGLMTLISLILHHSLEAHVDAWVVAPLIEEYAFRWVLMGLLLSWGMGLGMAILVQGILFAIAHIKNGFVYGMDSWIGVVSANLVIPFGFALGFIAIQYGLLYAFLLHVVFNIVFDLITIMTGGGGK